VQDSESIRNDLDIKPLLTHSTGCVFHCLIFTPFCRSLGIIIHVVCNGDECCTKIFIGLSHPKCFCPLRIFNSAVYSNSVHRSCQSKLCSIA